MSYTITKRVTQSLFKALSTTPLFLCLFLCSQQIDAGSTPSITPVPGEQSFPTGEFSVAYSPNGKWLATANYESNDISLFSVASNGVLTAISGSPLYSAPLCQDHS